MKWSSLSPWIITMIYLIPNSWSRSNLNYHTVLGEKWDRFYNNVLLLHLQKCTTIKSWDSQYFVNRFLEKLVTLKIGGFSTANLIKDIIIKNFIKT